MRVKRVQIAIIKCPKCGCEYESLSCNPDEPVKCLKCGFVFCGYDEPIPKRYIIEREVDALRCDICGSLIPCTPENFVWGMPLPAVACPRCKDPSTTGIHSSRIVGILYRKKWREIDFFMKKMGADGLHLAKSMRDKITAHLLLHDAKLNDDPSFLSFTVFDKSVLIKVLWVRGEAVGCYTFTVNDIWGVPCMHIIVVHRKHRNKGYGTQMIADFLSSFTGKIGFEKPNRIVCSILAKLGEVEEVENHFQSKGRVVFIQGGF